MLEPTKPRLIKTNEEFYERNFKIIGPEIWSKTDDPTKAIVDALRSGVYTSVGTCKRYTFQKYLVDAVDKEYFENTYLVEEPFESISKNLFVPFTNPYVDKFQG